MSVNTKHDLGGTLTARRWVAISGLVFVLAWVIGLLMEPGGPATTASAIDVASYYRAHQAAQHVQSYLIDGVAGIALLTFAAALHAVFRSLGEAFSAPASVVFGAGIAAGSVSLVQAAIGEAIVNPGLLASTDVSGVRLLFILLNEADTFKLLALALLAAVVAWLALQTRVLPAWIGWLGVLLAILLFVGGLSFVLGSDALYFVLYVALPLLLVWVGAISIASWLTAQAPRG